ncbi:MAG: LecA/PA-IL family lectin [Pyrinomonadaceae bacterium]
MTVCRRLLRTVASIGIIAVLTFSAFADTIRLKDGSIIKGRITTFSDGRFVVVIGEGERRREMSFAVTDIESVSFDNQAMPRPSTSASAAAKTPPKVVISNTSSVERQPSRPDPPVFNSPTQSSTTTPIRKTSTTKPIEVSVKVLADNSSNGWTNSGWVVKKGQKIRITGAGEITLGNGNKTAAGGLYELEDEAKLLKAVPTGALIAVIGDDNNDFIYIGASREFVAERDGALFLGINEGNLKDNTGSFEVKIEIDPEGE